MVNTLSAQGKILWNVFKDIIITIGDKFIPYLKELVSYIKENAEKFKDWEDKTRTIEQAIDTLASAIKQAKDNLGALSADTMAGLLQSVANALASFVKWQSQIKNVQKELTVVEYAFGGVALAIAGIHDMIVGLVFTFQLIKQAIEIGFRDALYSVLSVVRVILEGLNAIPGIDLSGALGRISSKMEDLAQKQKSIWDVQTPELWFDKVGKKLGETKLKIEELGKTKVTPEVVIDVDTQKLDEAYDKIGGKGLAAAEYALTKLGKTADKTGKAIGAEISKGSKKAAENTKKNADEIKLELEKITIQASLIKEAMKWESQIKIEQIRAATEKVKAMIDGLKTGVESAADTIGHLADAFVKAQGSYYAPDIANAIISMTESQIQMNEALVEYTKTQNEILKLKQQMLEDKFLSGEGIESVIKVEFNKPYPALLEFVVREMLDKARIVAQGEGFQCLGAI